MIIPTQFNYYSHIHMYSIIISLIISCILLILPNLIILKNYNIFLGFLLLLCKIFDSVFRVISEKEVIPNVFPIHMCNFSIIFTALFLIFNSNILFNISFFFSYGALFAIILPGINVYYNNLYVHIFMLNHFLQFVGIIYGFIYLNQYINFKGFLFSCITLNIIFIYSFIYNKIFQKYNINAMFLNDYMTPFLNFIKPFWFYQILLIFLTNLTFFVMYKVFSKKIFIL